jgi:hypothetical protein
MRSAKSISIESPKGSERRKTPAHRERNRSKTIRRGGTAQGGVIQGVFAEWHARLRRRGVSRRHDRPYERPFLLQGALVARGRNSLKRPDEAVRNTLQRQNTEKLQIIMLDS